MSARVVGPRLVDIDGWAALKPHELAAERLAHVAWQEAHAAACSARRSIGQLLRVRSTPVSVTDKVAR